MACDREQPTARSNPKPPPVAAANTANTTLHSPNPARIPKKSARVQPLPNPSPSQSPNVTARPERHEPAARRSERDVEDPTGEQRRNSNSVSTGMPYVEDGPDPEDFEGLTRAQLVNKLRLLSGRNANMSAEWMARERALFFNAIVNSSPSNNDDDDVPEVVKVGCWGFRDGPYDYYVGRIPDSALPTIVEHQRQYLKYKRNQEPWMFAPHCEKANPEEEWRSWLAEGYRIRSDLAMLNWQILLAQCHIGHLTSNIVFLKQFGLQNIDAITMCDSRTFDGYITSLSKLTGNRTIPFPARQCLKALYCWTRTFRITRGRNPKSQDFTPTEAERAWKRFTFEQNLVINPPSDPSVPEKFRAFETDQWKVFRDAVQAYASQTRGILNLPLSYLLRSSDTPERAVDDPTLWATPDLDEPITQTVLLDRAAMNSSSEIGQDNRRVICIVGAITPTYWCLGGDQTMQK
jgi:hypothetical protein